MITHEDNVEFVFNFHITRNEFRLYELTNTILNKRKRITMQIQQVFYILALLAGSTLIGVGIYLLYEAQVASSDAPIIYGSAGPIILGIGIGILILMCLLKIPGLREKDGPVREVV